MSHSAKLQEQIAPDAPIYSQFGDDEDLGELVAMYVDEMPGRIQSLVDAYQASSRDDLARLAHQLKGASGSYGFTQISTAAARLETGIRQQQPIEAAFDEVIDLCRRAQAGTAQN